MHQDELYTMHPLAICNKRVYYVEIVRESCKEGKRQGKMLCQHAAWPKMADAVIEAEFLIL
jgi:hypothetical protein